MADDPESVVSEEVSFRFTTNDNPAFQPFHLALGRLAMVWAEFEFSINAAIWDLANVSRHAGTCMTSQLIGPGPRFRCLVSLLNLREAAPELINAFNSLANEAEGLGRQRNRYLHDPLVFNTDDKNVYRIETTADRKLKHDFMPMDENDVTKLMTQIEGTADRFDDLFERVLAETPPWPRTQYEQSSGIHRHRTTPNSADG
jgi:hypothetical protein